MRAGNPARFPDQTDSLPATHLRPQRHEHLGEVKIGREETASVVDHHRVTRAIAGAREHHDAVVGGADRLSDSPVEIRSEVLVLFLAVVQAQVAEMRGDQRRPRPSEALAEQQPARGLVVRVAEGDLILRHPAPCLGWRVDVAVCHLQLPAGKAWLDHLDSQRDLRRIRSSVARRELECQAQLSRWLFHRDSDDCFKPTRGSKEGQGLFSEAAARRSPLAVDADENHISRLRGPRLHFNQWTCAQRSRGAG